MLRHPPGSAGKGLVLTKIIVRQSESIDEAVRRFGTLCRRTGLRKELRRRQYYEKPSDARRRERERIKRRIRKNQSL